MNFTIETVTHKQEDQYLTGDILNMFPIIWSFIGSGNDLWHVERQAISWTNVNFWATRLSGTHFTNMN